MSIGTRAGQAIDVIRRSVGSSWRAAARGRYRAARRAPPQGATAVRPSLGEGLEHARQRRGGAPPGAGRGVVVGVVQQQHRALAGAVGHARGDRLGRGARLPVPAPVAPQQRAPAARAREAQRGGVEHAVGRAVQLRRAAGGRLDDLAAPGRCPRAPAAASGAAGCDGGRSAGRSRGRRRRSRGRARGCAAPARRRGRRSRARARGARISEHRRRALRRAGRRRR